MNLNVLKPGQAVESAFQKPNVGLAIALVFVSCLVVLGQTIFLGFPFDIAGFAVNVLIRYYISFFVLAVLLYLACFVLKGKQTVSGKFAGIVSALGLLQVLAIVALLIYTAGIPLIFSPLAIELVKDVASGQSTTEILAIQVNFLAANNIETVNMAAFYAFGIVLGAIGLFNLYLLYKIVSKLFQYRVLANIIVLVIVLILLGLLPF